MSEWLNNKVFVDENAVKPCGLLRYCPYGQLVEEFPFRSVPDHISCEVFGHNCPVFYLKEEIFCDREI